MGRLSLYTPEKGNDFRFIDRAIEEQFQIGGVDIYVHRYMGPKDPLPDDVSPATPVQTNPIGELGIQDIILMENRDRKYDPDVYIMRGIYQMQDLDFNLSQFGIFLSNDNIFVHFHLRNCVETLTRKLMSGDVLEFPHLKDEYALDQAEVALKRFYVVQDVTRAASGFSQTWYPHLLRVKCVPLVDTQEFADILDADAGANDGTTIRDLLSTANLNKQINDQIIAQAEFDVPLSGYNTKQYYVIPHLVTEHFDDKGAVHVLSSPDRNYYVGYLTGDGYPPNGLPYTFGTSWPSGDIATGQYHLRTDYFPNRLFRFNGASWNMVEENLRMTLTNNWNPMVPNQDSSTSTYTTLNRQASMSTFINNNNTATIAGEVVVERQALSKVLKPRADN